MGNSIFARAFALIDDLLHGTFYVGFENKCNLTEATFPVSFFEPGEYSRAQEEIHHVFGACAAGMAALWLGQILNRLDKSFVLVWSGRGLQFMGYFLFLWLFCLMSPLNIGRNLWAYVFRDWQQLQHIALAFIFVASGSAETVAGTLLIAEKKQNSKRLQMYQSRRKNTRSILLLLHIAWSFHLMCAGVVFLFHPQVHPSHLVMHRVLGVSVAGGSISMGVSKCVETIVSNGERLKYYSLMLVPQALWIAVIQILLFFPHHGTDVHLGFRPTCQPVWLRAFVFFSGMSAVVSIALSTYIGRHIVRSYNFRERKSSGDVDCQQRLRFIRTRSAGGDERSDLVFSSASDDDDDDDDDEFFPANPRRLGVFDAL
eukprot:g1800.t1